MAKLITSGWYESLAYHTLPFKEPDETYISEDLEDSPEAYPGTPG